MGMQMECFKLTIHLHITPMLLDTWFGSLNLYLMWSIHDFSFLGALIHL
jgi:hypothetical protein